jgi:hypothetical protein
MDVGKGPTLLTVNSASNLANTHMTIILSNLPVEQFQNKLHKAPTVFLLQNSCRTKQSINKMCHY